MKHDFTSVQNIYIICGKTDMRNYAKSTIMGSRDSQNHLLHNQSNKYTSHNFFILGYLHKSVSQSINFASSCQKGKSCIFRSIYASSKAFLFISSFNLAYITVLLTLA